MRAWATGRNVVRMNMRYCGDTDLPSPTLSMRLPPTPLFPELFAERPLQGVDTTSMHDFENERDLPTVLLIDDDPFSRDVNAMMLTLDGFTAHTAADSAASLKLLTSGECVPGVILMDVQMPAGRKRRAMERHGEPSIKFHLLQEQSIRLAIRNHPARQIIRIPSQSPFTLPAR